MPNSESPQVDVHITLKGNEQKVIAQYQTMSDYTDVMQYLAQWEKETTCPYLIEFNSPDRIDYKVDVVLYSNTDFDTMKLALT